MKIPVELFQIIVGVLFGLVGWLGNEMWNLIKKLQENMSRMQSDLPKDYVQKDDYKQDIGRVHELLDRIYEKLDHKEDKSR